jgi:hypothetical protein
MRPLSASEAIGPALERTRDFLARPFRWRTFFKLAAVAFFAEMGGGFNSSFSHRTGSGAHGLPPAFLAFLVAFAVIIGLISLVIGLILLYIGSRLQLVLVELVATRQSWVSPVWRRVSSATWRWIGLKLLFFLCILLISLPFTIPVILFFVHHSHDLSAGGFFSGLHIAQIILYVAIAILAVIVIGAIYLLVRDLALPFMALEDLSISDALGRLRAIVNAEPGQVALYLLLRVLLGFIFGLMAEIATVLVLLISLVPPGIVGFILWFSMRGTGAGGKIVLIGLGVFAGLVFLCWAIFVGICFLGSALTFCQAYALYFLGGRYPLLGDLLDRSAPPPQYAYTPGYPPTPPQSPPPQTAPPAAPTAP